MSIDGEIRREKTVEAVRKNMMGGNGKLGAIARLLGHPIHVDHSGIECDFDDPWALHDPDEIPTYGDGSQNFLGWVWDGLNQGVHMEIRLEGWGTEVNDPRAFVYEGITVNYKGYLVYKEELGELVAYASKHPMVGEWEHLLDSLYERARKVKIKLEDERQEVRQKENKGISQKILEALRMRWGD